MTRQHRLVYISRNYRNVTSAGNKAKTDNEQTLEELGAVNLGLKRSFHKSKIATFFLNFFGVIRYCFRIKRGDILFLQYPVKKYFSFLCRVAHWRNAKTISLIHDLGSFRRKKITPSFEISRLSHSDYIIATNETMSEWLRAQGLTRPLGALNIHDYRSASTPENHSQRFIAKDHFSIAYAGSLSSRKNSFLFNLNIPKSITFHIYGHTTDLHTFQSKERIVFHDFTPADEFIAHAIGDFGLVWDGNDATQCSGAFGEYLRYNTPHKISFYLRAGLPIIIWREAAMASYIENNGLGICIDSLNNLEQHLQSISDDEFRTMKENVNTVAEKIKKGEFLKNALNEAIEYLVGENQKNEKKHEN